MQISSLTPDYAVSPQITAEDVAQLKDAGFGTVVCNRPDQEVQPDLQAAAIQAAVEAAGLVFVMNPVMPGMLTADNVRIQQETLAGADAPVFAYCRSGNRSSVVWALALAGKVPADELINCAAQAGHDLSGMRAHLEAAEQG